MFGREGGGKVEGGEGKVKGKKTMVKLRRVC